MNLIILWTCASIAGIVFSVMLYSIAAFHAPVGTLANATPSAFRHRKGVELLWALVPIMIVIGMAAPAVRTLLPTDASSSFVQTVTPSASPKNVTAPRLVSGQPSTIATP